MSLDRELLEVLKAKLRDRYTAVELCEILNLSEDDILEAFEHLLMEVDWDEI